MSVKSVVTCGAVAGALIGAAFIFWKVKKRYEKSPRGFYNFHARGHGHGHGHGHEDDDKSIDMWINVQFGNETDPYVQSFSPEEASKFYSTINDLCCKHKNNEVISRALDIGCSSGRTTFDLAKVFDEVIGIDISSKSIEKANQLKKNGCIPYSIYLEGDIKKSYTAVVDPKIDRSHVQFMVGDANALSDTLGQFGMIIMINTLHHISDPKQFLFDVKNLLLPGGILLLAEIYSWHEMLDLPKDRWVAGYVKNDGTEVRGVDGLKDILLPEFDLLEQKDVQSLVQWKARMYMVSFPEVTVWKKK